MFSHNSYLILGELSTLGVNPVSLSKSGYELTHCSYSFIKQIDNKGEVQSNTIGGVVKVEINSIPSKELIDWSLNHRRYHNGAIIFCDDSGTPLEKLFFTETACIEMELSYIKTGNGYIKTQLTLSAKTLTFGRITFNSKWINI